MLHDEDNVPNCIPGHVVTLHFQTFTCSVISRISKQTPALFVMKKGLFIIDLDAENGIFVCIISLSHKHVKYSETLNTSPIGLLTDTILAHLNGITCLKLNFVTIFGYVQKC